MAPPLRYLVPYILFLAFQYVFAKDALRYASPATMEAVVSFIGFVALMALARGRLILNRQTLIFSFFFWLSSAFWIAGLNFITPGQSAVLSFTMPLFTIPLSVLMLGERSSRAEVYGGAIGFAGVVLFNIPLLTGAVQALGVALALGGAFFWAVFSVYLKRLSSQDPIQTVSTGFLVCALLWGASAFIDFGVRPTFELSFDLAYLGLVSGVGAISLYALLMRSERVTKLTTMIFVTPVITLAYGVITTGVLPGYLTLGGVALIFAGIYASNMLAPRGAPEVLAPAQDGRPPGPAREQHSS